ncbi:MAG: hypothetical protein ACRC92_04370 [Peptostreptococcaceae bacterium]
MKIYLPKILATSPTYLPPLEKTIFYYIIHCSFKAKADYNEELMLEINIKELIEIINESNLNLIDTKILVEQAINKLTKIKISLVDNGFHLKISPIQSLYLNKSLLYITLDPIIVDYLDQILYGNYATYDLLTNTIEKMETRF